MFCMTEEQEISYASNRKVSNRKECYVATKVHLHKSTNQSIIFHIQKLLLLKTTIPSQKLEVSDNCDTCKKYTPVSFYFGYCYNNKGSYKQMNETINNDRRGQYYDKQHKQQEGAMEQQNNKTIMMTSKPMNDKGKDDMRQMINELKMEEMDNNNHNNGCDHKKIRTTTATTMAVYTLETIISANI